MSSLNLLRVKICFLVMMLICNYFTRSLWWMIQIFIFYLQCARIKKFHFTSRGHVLLLFFSFFLKSCQVCNIWPKLLLLCVLSIIVQSQLLFAFFSQLSLTFFLHKWFHRGYLHYCLEAWGRLDEPTSFCFFHQWAQGR